MTDFALSEIKKTKVFEDFDKLFEKPKDGAKVQFNGSEYPASMMNVILVENPELLDVEVRHADPDTAERLTHIKRLRMIHRLAK